MDFVVLLKFRSSVSAAEADAGLGRRAAWKYPEGVQVIAEYWPLSSAVQVVSILSADSVKGLRIGSEVFPRLLRMQQQA